MNRYVIEHVAGAKPRYKCCELLENSGVATADSVDTLQIPPQTLDSSCKVKYACAFHRAQELF